MKPSPDRSASVIRLLPAVVWMAVIFALSSQRQFPSPGGLSVELQAIAAHLFLFGTLALLIAIGLEPYRPRMRWFQLVVVAFVVLYGITDEIHQSFVPGRTPDPFDVLVDGIGASIAVIIWGRVRVWRRAAR